MNSCAFCGMPPLDGEPCCTATYRRDVMRKADARIKRQDELLRTVELRADNLDLLLRAALGAVTFERREKGWFVACASGAVGTYRNERGQALGWDWVLQVPDDGAALPKMTAELRSALSLNQNPKP